METTIKKYATDIVAEHVLKNIEQILASDDKPRWYRPWTLAAGGNMPFNFDSKRRYSGLNLLMLLLEQEVRGYSSSAWLTFHQIQKMGGKVKRDSKGCPIVFFKKQRIEKDDSETQEEDTANNTRSVLRYYHVYNASCIEGIDFDVSESYQNNRAQSVDEWEKVIHYTKANIEHREQNDAFYDVASDCIVMPLQEQFKTTEDYYATIFHELAHWTGHEKRLDRKMNEINRSDDNYAFEELVAELTAVFLSLELGFSILHTKNIRYIGCFSDMRCGVAAIVQPISTTQPTHNAHASLPIGRQASLGKCYKAYTRRGYQSYF